MANDGPSDLTAKTEIMTAKYQAAMAQIRAEAEIKNASERGKGKSDDFKEWLRATTPGYNWDWPYLVKIREALNGVTNGTIKRLMLLLPPRHGKSSIATIRYPIYRMEKDPTIRVCVGCYSQEFAKKFGRMARGIARRRKLPLSEEKAAAKEWETVAGGVYRSCGVGSPPTGEGFELLIVDDPIKQKEEADSIIKRDRVWDWWTIDLMTRLEPNAAIIVISTPWHVDDMMHRILKSEDAQVDPWTVLRFPAEAEENDPLGRKVGEPLCPERYDKKALASRKRVLGARQYSALFGMKPKADEGSLFQRKWIEPNRCILEHDQIIFPDGLHAIIDEHPAIMTVDPAMGGRHSDDTGVGGFMFVGDRIVVLRSIGRRIPIETLPDEVDWWARTWYPRYAGVEANGFQRQVVKDIREKVRLPVRELDPAGESKKSRAFAATVMAEEGRIYWLDPDDDEDDWYEKWMTELENFTGEGDEKDAQVDCLAYAVLEYEQMIGLLDDPGPTSFGGMNREVNGQIVQSASRALPAASQQFGLQRWMPGMRGGSVG